MAELRDLLGYLQGRGWTAAALADALEVSRHTVERWSVGEYAPRAQGPVLIVLRQLRTVPVPKRHRSKGTGPSKR